MIKRWVPVITLLLLPILVLSQNFNDSPGRDDEMYTALLFPASTVPKFLALPDNLPVEKRALTAQSLVEYAYSYLGTPYRTGATGNGSFDCSGFTQDIFKQIGLNLPHSSGAQASIGKVITLEEVQPGDLLFFKGRNSRRKGIGHVAMVSEVLPDGTIKMIHVTIGKGVMVDTPFKSNYYKPRYIGARRVLNP